LIHGEIGPVAFEDSQANRVSDKIAPDHPVMLAFFSLPRPGIEFVSLSESLDTATPAGRMVFNVLGAPVAFAS